MTEVITTCGNFSTEADACAYFDSVIETSGAFRMYKEVWGNIIQPRFNQPIPKALRLDRVLIPNVGSDWLYGPIGVEIKRSNIRANNAVAQSIDYSRCVWELPRGFLIVVRWVFIFPMTTEGGFAGSVMAQNQIGTIKSSWNDANGKRLTFQIAGQTVMECQPNTTQSFSPPAVIAGQRVGSR